MKIVFSIVSIAALVGSCSIQPDRLEEALRAAGKNRFELEKVLDRYASDPEDSLKVQAAIFLIENMPGHYTYSGEKFTEYRRQMDSIHPKMPYTVKRAVYSIPLRESDFTDGLERAYDLETITGDFLIAHIDNLMECRKNAPWLRKLDFKDFCEYVLPYRAGNEPLIGADDSTRFVWAEIARQTAVYPDLPRTLENAVFFYKEVSRNRDDFYWKDLQTPSGSYDFDCIDRSFFDIYSLRSAGIPCAVDFIPHWPTRNGQHYWKILIDPDILSGGTHDMDHPRAAKVYRKTYSRNPLPSPKNEKELVPDLFRDPFNRDVSSRYLKVTDLTVELSLIEGHRPEYGYLCVFNNLDWYPVAWGKVENGKMVCPDMGVNVIYLPVYFHDREAVQAGYPFKLLGNGETVPLIPDPETLTLRFTRKYPLTFSKIRWTQNLMGVCFEGSDDPEFRQPDTLHVITEPNPGLQFVTVPIDSSRLYRYWRASKSGRFLNFGELEFIGTNGRKMSGEIIVPAERGSAWKAFDGNSLTYSNTFDWLGMDFGRPVALSAIRYVSRTDDNGINEDDLYELLYHGPDGWEQVGLEEPQGGEVTFTGVPADALYWLRNLDQGQEERIFTYEYGENVFW